MSAILTPATLKRGLTGNPRMQEITAAFTARPTLLADELRRAALHGRTHQQRWRELSDSDYGRRGGSAGERRLICEGLALLEAAELLHDRNPAASDVRITTGEIDLALLRKQRNWVLTLPACEEREGLTNLLDHLLDRAEGYPDTPAGAVCDASSIEADTMAAQRRGL